MWDKRHYATQIISNLTFDPAVLAAWVTRVRARDVHLPVLVGLPGPVERMSCSAWRRRSAWASRRGSSPRTPDSSPIAAPSGYDPLRFLGGATQVLGLPEMNVAGLHLFTFNQVAETEAWRVEQLRRLRDAPTRRRTGRAPARFRP